MKITQLETIFIKPRWLFLKVHTDEGLVGLGEPVVEGRSQTVATPSTKSGAISSGRTRAASSITGRRSIAGSSNRGGPVLCSPSLASSRRCGNITGKWLGVPVYQLLGGATRDKIRMYGWLGGETYGDYIESAKVSANHYTTADLTQAKHTYELIRRETITLNLDYKQSGLGSASCGPGRLEKYQLKPEETHYRVRLRPLTPSDSPIALSKQVLE